MLTLSGCVIKTVFGIVFFQVEQDSDHGLYVSPDWWLYIAVTIPLTVLVLAVWVAWLKRQVRAAIPLLLDSEIEKG